MFGCKKECKYCPRCHKHCPDFIPYDYHCKLTDKAPYVCNGCQKKAQCRLDKYFLSGNKSTKGIQNHTFRIQNRHKSFRRRIDSSGRNYQSSSSARTICLHDTSKSSRNYFVRKNNLQLHRFGSFICRQS